MTSDTRGVSLAAFTIPAGLMILALSPAALAEQGAGGVAGSGIEQGTGAITTRSDVALSVESLPGTSSLRLGAIGEAVGTQMTAIRTCYADVAAQRPITEGMLQLRVQIPAGRGATQLEIAANTTADQGLTDCVVGAIRRAPLMRVRGPAGGLVVVHFANTAARGAAMVAREQANAPAAQVQTVNGRPQARGSTPGNEVTLTIAGTGSTAADAVASLFQNAQARIGTFLDCRRRAGRRGADPSGEMTLSFRVPARGAASGQRVASTVADPNAPQCILRSLTEAARGQAAAAGAYEITVRFEP
jgi:hypothetical protein